MERVRAILVGVLIPVYLFVGAFLSWWLSELTGIWVHYLHAIIIPLLGIVGTWLVAPVNKVVFTTLIYLFGVVLAYMLASPLAYPETHEQAYQLTQVPFVMSCVWGAVLLGGLWFAKRYGWHKFYGQFKRGSGR